MQQSLSELKDDALKKIKAYGFTKYHQKLMKDTNYLFLNEDKKKIIESKNEIKELKRQTLMSVPIAYIQTAKQDLKRKIKSQELHLKFYIWGHSLDVSDQEYIIDLFSLNDDIDRNVRVIIFYFDNNAKFSLLANLLHILGKHKVEHWMKQGWLKFELNPEVTQFNEIEPLELKKYES